MEKKYQVFISSTYEDLIDERKNVIVTLLSCDCIPTGMEAFCAEDEEQFEIIKKVINLCDYYVLIIARRYGSICESTKISYTEMEYDYAVSIGIPILVFPLDGRVTRYKEDEDNVEMKSKLLKNFRKKVMDKRMASPKWKNSDDLSKNIALAIPKAIAHYKRPGWIRDDCENSLFQKNY